jgi:hypothetical protein
VRVSSDTGPQVRSDWAWPVERRSSARICAKFFGTFDIPLLD